MNRPRRQTLRQTSFFKARTCGSSSGSVISYPCAQQPYQGGVGRPTDGNVGIRTTTTLIFDTSIARRGTLTGTQQVSNLGQEGIEAEYKLPVSFEQRFDTLDDSLCVNPGTTEGSSIRWKLCV